MKVSFRRVTPLAALTMALVLAGCASSVKLDDVPVENRTPSSAAGDGAAGASQSGVAAVDVSGQDQMAGLAKVVYFDFDSFVVKDEYRPIIEGNAKRLSADRAKRIVVEGHADERGGREYNLALGQKRAEAVTRAMVLLGAQESQVESVSYGEERPAVQGSDEAAWAKNRRAELRDR